MVITTKTKLRLCTGLNLAHSITEVRDGKNFWQLPHQEIRLNAIHWSAIPQNKSSSDLFQRYLAEENILILDALFSIVEYPHWPLILGNIELIKAKAISPFGFFFYILFC